MYKYFDLPIVRKPITGKNCCTHPSITGPGEITMSRDIRSPPANDIAKATEHIQIATDRLTAVRGTKSTNKKKGYEN